MLYTVVRNKHNKNAPKSPNMIVYCGNREDLLLALKYSMGAAYIA